MRRRSGAAWPPEPQRRPEKTTARSVYLVLALILNILAMNPEAGWAKRHTCVAAEVRALIKWAVPLLMLVIWSSLIAQAMI